jgi:murein L,D-transpeptidase YcbB/YkuD
MIAKGVPVFITYLTARADGGTIAFADDVYRLDDRSGEALAAN